jgi:predicted flap endonuclease-1-like 5' DNA nuclease
MNKVILVTGTIVGVAYLTELFIAWYSGYTYEQFAFFNRALGPYWWAYFGMMFCNVVTPQFFWSKKLRRNIGLTFFLSIVVNIGMWFERFVIIATTLARDYLPSSWSFYVPSWVEIGIFIGTMGLFFTLYLIFVRVAPVVAIAEVKSILKSSGDQYLGPNAIAVDHGHSHSDPIHAKAKTKDNATEVLEDVAAIVTEKVKDTKSDPSSMKVSNTYVPSSRQEGSVKDDLKLIEGIGPKIEEVLNNSAISTYIDLVNTDVGRLRAILDNAGSNFKSHDPETWSAQAKLASEDKWDELKKWQDELDGGKTNKK